MALLISPMVVPIVIVGVGVYFFYAPLGLTGSLLGLTLAHTVLAVPFVLITVSATLAGFDQSWSGQQQPGAPPLLTFRRVVLPTIAPGVVSGAIFAFVTSFDEVVVALFLTGPGGHSAAADVCRHSRKHLAGDCGGSNFVDPAVGSADGDHGNLAPHARRLSWS